MGDDRGGNGGKTGGERRKSARLPVEMWVEDITDGSQVHRRAGNLSSGGIYLDQTIPLPLGSLVRLRLTLPGDRQAITVTGQIVSSAAKAFGMGVKFVDVAAEDQRRIDTFLDRALTPPVGTPTI